MYLNHTGFLGGVIILSQYIFSAAIMCSFTGSRGSFKGEDVRERSLGCSLNVPMFTSGYEQGRAIVFSRASVVQQFSSSPTLSTPSSVSSSASSEQGYLSSFDSADITSILQTYSQHKKETLTLLLSWLLGQHSSCCRVSAVSLCRLQWQQWQSCGARQVNMS